MPFLPKQFKEKNKNEKGGKNEKRRIIMFNG